MKKTSLLAFVALTGVTLAHQGANRLITMVFTDTDASLALMAISMRTGANIVYANKTKQPITLKLSVNTTEEAVRSVSSSAGLVYKKVGSVYIVAQPSGIRDALGPYMHTTTYAVDTGTADQIVQRLLASIPTVSAQANGDRVILNSVNEDVQDAIAIIRSVHPALVTKNMRALVVMHQMTAEEAAPLIKGFYPGLTVTNTESAKGLAPGQNTAAGGTSNRWAPESHGAIGLIGPEELVNEAKKTLELLDTPPEGSQRDAVTYTVYNLKYLNAPSAVDFLKKSAPEIDAFTGPEQISPPRATFSSMTSAITSAQNGGSGAAGGAAGGAAASGGAVGATGAGGTSTGPNGNLKSGERAKSIILKGRRGDVESAVKMITQLDVKPRQCIVEVNVVETSPKDAEQLGLGWSFNPINFFNVPAGTVLGNTTSGSVISAPTTRPVGIGQVSISPLNFQAILSALVSHEKAKILSKPSLQVIDNDQASVFIGNTISVELQGAGALGAASQSIAQFPVGIILLISPKISPDGTVTMHVNPVISSVSSIDANGIPQTAAREADTTVIVRDGETVVLGGLIQDQESVTTSAVPGLSQLPLLGQLFKSRNKSHSRTDIVVSLTTHIVKDKENP